MKQANGGFETSRFVVVVVVMAQNTEYNKNKKGVFIIFFDDPFYLDVLGVLEALEFLRRFFLFLRGVRGVSFPDFFRFAFCLLRVALLRLALFRVALLRLALFRVALLRKGF